MEKLGGQRMDLERSMLLPGDVIVVSWYNDDFFTLPAGSVGWVGYLESRPRWWMNIKGAEEHCAAGFYSAGLGPVPFAIGGLPNQLYYVVKVFSRVQYKSQPVNPQEVRAGDMPSFSSYLSYSEVDNKTTFRMESEVALHLQQASQLKGEGKIAEAIQHYRQALAVDSNNPVVLNNLAWILATANKPELRDGQEAVRLATKAVKLTDFRRPIFIGTLAAAYAEAGQFSQACEMANVASYLNQLTGPTEKVTQNAK
jgi:tetratricopeptide (TPR) repeat protein